MFPERVVKTTTPWSERNGCSWGLFKRLSSELMGNEGITHNQFEDAKILFLSRRGISYTTKEGLFRLLI